MHVRLTSRRGPLLTFHRHRQCRPQRAEALIVRAELSPGDTVKVTEDIKVWHVPGFKEGLDLAGKEGVIDKNVTMYKDTKLSPNLPWKVAFEVEGKGGKVKKFFVHMDESEIEAA